MDYNFVANLSKVKSTDFVVTMDSHSIIRDVNK
jgi:hypothetical protein